MAVITMPKNAIFNLSMNFPQSSSSPLSLGNSSCKVSRVCFATASKFSQGRRAAEENRGTPYETKKWRNERDVSTHVKQADSSADKAKEYASDATEKTKGAAGTATEKTKQGIHEAADTAEGVAGTVVHKVKEGSSNAADTEADVKGKAEDAGANVVDKVKEGSSKAAETVEGTAKGAWESIKETGETVREAVVGDIDSKI